MREFFNIYPCFALTFQDEILFWSFKNQPPMNLIKKMTQKMDQYKLTDILLVVLIAVMVVIYKMNKA